MMQLVADFPYFEIQFNKRGDVDEPAAVDALIEFCADGGATDLLVISHGWNNDMAQARALYRELLGNIRAQLPAVALPADRDLAVMAILWPSKKFAERDLIPGGAASLGAPDNVSSDDLRTQLDELSEDLDDSAAAAGLAEAKLLVDGLEDNTAAQQNFVALLREHLLPQQDVRQDPESDAELPGELWELPGDELLQRFSEEPEESGAIDFEAGGAAGGIGGGFGDDSKNEMGGAAGFGEFFGSIKAGARNLLNLLTYYKMKNRAAVVGMSGVHQVLAKVRGAQPQTRLHLVGHSFGGRLVSAAAKGADDSPMLAIDSIALLQAAFSHYGFADQWDPSKSSPGFFREVLSGNRLRGSMIVTHTANDRAVGIAYALASRLTNQVAAAIGDENDIYGGIGRNGALATPEAQGQQMQPIGGAGYGFSAGSVYNLQADKFIEDHGDVAGEEVALAILSAVAIS